MSTSKKMVAVVFGIALLVVLSGCLKQTDESTKQAKVVPAQSEEESSLVPAFQTEETVAASDWQNFSGNSVQFKYPSGWQVENISTVGFEDRELALRVKNTDKQILLGAVVLPADYFKTENGQQVVDAQKYAVNYSLITVEVYRGQSGKSWADFFQKQYPDVVTDFEPMQAAFLPTGLDSVRVTRVSGLYPGKARVFIRKGDRIYDIALLVQGDDALQANRVFNSLLQNFQF